jgi:class 3 adenylate cyclase/TolB-like protein/Flp pilus assembly protein TadD
MGADAVGYSRLMGEDESDTLDALRTCRATIERLVGEHEGRVFSHTGDGLMAEFPSAVEAVRCAIEVQKELHGFNDARPAERRMDFRIGLNLGDVVVEGDDLFGDGVNVAARLQTLADPGGVCLSGSVFDQVEGKIGIGCSFIGEEPLKNVTKPVRAYRLDLDPSGRHLRLPPMLRRRRWRRVAAAAIALGAVLAVAVSLYLTLGQTPPAGSPASTPLGRTGPVIAVLPFVNQGGEDYFSDGITVEITSALGRFSDLTVIAHTAASTYKGSTLKPADIARELGAGYLLQGTVFRRGDQVRVVPELIEAATGAQKWSKPYEREMKDIFAVQDEITRSVVAATAIKVTRLEQERALATPTSNLAAHDLVLRGIDALERNNRSSNLEARRMFLRAIELDTDYAAAHAGLGWTYYFAVTGGWTEFVGDDLAQAEDFARKALLLDEDSADARRLLGQIYTFQKRFDVADGELARAIDLNPNDWESHAVRGIVALYAGDSKRSVERLEFAKLLNPALAHDYRMNLGFAYYLQARYDDAIQIASSVGTGEGIDYFTHAVLAAAYGQLGRTDEAAREAQSVRRMWPFFNTDKFAAQWQEERDRALILEGLRKAGLP